MRKVKAHLCDTYDVCKDKDCFLRKFIFGDVVENVDTGTCGIVIDKAVWDDLVMVAYSNRVEPGYIPSKKLKVISSNRDAARVCDRHPIWKYD